MAAQIRVLRRRIRSTQSIKKITRAMELIATSRIAKARARVDASRPYAEQITAVLTALASNAALDHPLLVERENTKRAAVLVVTSDRGQSGGYNVNVLKEAEQLQQLLREQGKEPVLYVIGRKGVNYYRFRKRPVEAAWTGLLRAADLRERRGGRPGAGGVVHGRRGRAGRGGRRGGDRSRPRAAAASTSCTWCTRSSSNMVTQMPDARRMAPLEVEYADQDEVTGEREHEGEEHRTVPEEGVHRLYEFEPDADDAVRRAAAQVHRRAAVRGAARVGGLGVGEPTAGHEGRDRQRERVDP